MPSTAPKPQTKIDAYSEVEKLLRAYENKLTARTGTVKNKRDLHLISVRSIEYMGRMYPEMYFASVIEQKNFVGFYLMTACHPSIKEKLSPSLLKLLKGKSCFHIRQLTPELKRDISDALKVAFEGYRKLGWV